MADNPHEKHRVLGYLTTLTTYGSAVAALSFVGGRRGAGLPEGYGAQDLVLGAVATHKCARLIAKDGVTTPVRAPFTHFEEHAGSGEVNERPDESTEPRHVVGELVSCPFCLAPWLATGYVAGLVLAPRWARAWAAVFSMVAGSDFLQQAYGRVRTD